MQKKTKMKKKTLAEDAVCCPDKVGNQEIKKMQKKTKMKKKTLAEDAVCCLDKVKTGIAYLGKLHKPK